MARPILEGVHPNGDGDTVFDFDQNVTPAPGSGGFNAAAFHRTNQAGATQKGTSIADASGDTITVHFHAGPPGFTSVPGSATLLDPSTIVSGASGDTAYPFVNRPAWLHILSIDYDLSANTAVVHWNTLANLADANGLTFKPTGSAGRKMLALSSGDDTDTWTITTTAAANGLAAGTYAASTALALDDDGQANTAASGSLTEVP